MALLLLLLLPGALGAQGPGGSGMVTATPVKARSAVAGVVTAFDDTTKVATLIGSSLLQVDLSTARIVMADADDSDVTPPPIGPGAYLKALVEAPDVAITIYPPPPLVAVQASVRPPGFAFLHGEIESVGTDGFGLLHRMILVDGKTVFGGENAGVPIHGLADLKPGMQAEVWVWAAGDTLTAAKVVAHGKPIVVKPVSFRGVVKAITPTSWTIDDKTVAVTADTKIVDNPQVGDTVQVLATETAGSLTALLIARIMPPPSPPPGRTTTFDGVVQTMPPSGTIGLWTISERVVTVTGLTKIEGTPKVGSKVTVTGYALPSPVMAPGGMSGSATGPMATPFLAISIKTKS